MNFQFASCSNENIMSGVHYLASRYNNKTAASYWMIWERDIFSAKLPLSSHALLYLSLALRCVFMIRSYFMPPPYFAFSQCNQEGNIQTNKKRNKKKYSKCNKNVAQRKELE